VTRARLNMPSGQLWGAQAHAGGSGPFGNAMSRGVKKKLIVRITSKIIDFFAALHIPSAVQYKFRDSQPIQRRGVRLNAKPKIPNLQVRTPP
jgi:hypothetical protein